MSTRLLCISVLIAGLAPAFAADPTPEQLAFFESKIRPILTNKCYKCHSVEQGKAKGGLTLDTPDGVKKGGENGAVLVPGDVEHSKIIIAVRYTDPDMQMPPKGEKLSGEEIAALEQWVKMGAPDPRKAAGAGKLTGLTEKAKNHWAFQPVKKPAVPTGLKNQQWCRTPVDNFILAKLQEHGMSPSPDASPETLLRRVFYDMWGLPPDPRTIMFFAADPSPKNYEAIVDALLNSPHYGERWGRYWLDSARYADTVGTQVNVQRADYRYPDAWVYRDYVIQSFNEDKPWDKFILEQLAADKLPDIKPDDPRLAALGFLTVGERFNNPNDIIDDRINTVSKAFLGVTLACSRCHDHKFDPIPTKDYYAWHGIFASCTEPLEKPLIKAPSPNPADAAAEARLTPQQRAQLEAKRAEQRAAYQKQLAALEKENRDAYYEIVGRVIDEFHKKVKPYLEYAAVGLGGKNKDNAENEKLRIKISNENNLDRDVRQFVSRHVREGFNPIFGPYKQFAEIKPEEFSQKAPKVLAEITANKSGKQKVNPLVASAFRAAKIESLDDVISVYEKLFANFGAKTKDYIAAASNTPKGSPVAGFDDNLAQLVQEPFNIEPAGELTTERLREISARLPNQLLGRAKFVFAKINELQLTNPGAPARAMVLVDKPHPQDSPVFIRGEQNNRGPIEPRHFLSILKNGNPEPYSNTESGRLQLAKDIASKDNPLTARVVVNRVWLHHFGEGFVRTPDDLGNMSEPPTHPELIDYLASYLMENNWSLKKLHKLILMSRVYQESSYTHPEFEKIDPENRLLWRANIRRLDFESLRDTLLVLSGRLDPKMGGQPVNIVDEPYSYRRSIYGYIDRGAVPELLQLFDFSDPEMPNSKRTVSIVPQQALFLMNSPFVIDVARRIIARPEVASARSDVDKIYMIYRVIFQRAPKPYEVQFGRQFLANEQLGSVKFGSQSEDVEKDQAKLTDKERKKLAQRKNQGNAAMRALQNEGDVVDRKQLTPWETYAQALLLSNEASYVN